MSKTIHHFVAGTPSASAPNGSTAIDTTNGLLYVRIGGAWVAMASTSALAAARSLKASIESDTPSSGTTETAIVTFAVPAGLIETGDQVTIKYAANINNSGGGATSSVTMRSRWDWTGTPVTIHTWDGNTVGAGKTQLARGEHTFTARSTTTAIGSADYRSANGTWTTTPATTAATGLDFTSAMTLALTVQVGGGATAAVTFFEATIYIDKKAA